jgi:hypothetical protein
MTKTFPANRVAETKTPASQHAACTHAAGDETGAP